MYDFGYNNNKSKEEGEENYENCSKCNNAFEKLAFRSQKSLSFTYIKFFTFHVTQ
jgi:hypothetical protein